jgi:hypothetical protein
MNGNSTPGRGLRGFWKWATTPPQAYVAYVLALILVWGISFLAGTLSPRKTGSRTPPPVSTQQR